MVMQSITHEDQQSAWEKEHSEPSILLQMDRDQPSSGLPKFLEFLKEQYDNIENLKGLEICCGKGRNVNWLASQGINAFGFDFSPSAINIASVRASANGLDDNAHFIVQDATLSYPYAENQFDFVIDCFGTTDIETPQGRQATRDNILKVLKPGGFLLVYLLSDKDEFHKKMVSQYPGPDEGSFIWPENGKYEKVFSEDEIKEIYNDLNLVVLERVNKTETFFNEQYQCSHIWAIFQNN